MLIAKINYTNLTFKVYVNDKFEDVLFFFGGGAQSIGISMYIWHNCHKIIDVRWGQIQTYFVEHFI